VVKVCRSSPDVVRVNRIRGPLYRVASGDLATAEGDGPMPLVAAVGPGVVAETALCVGGCPPPHAIRNAVARIDIASRDTAVRPGWFLCRTIMGFSFMAIGD
jgi:hypothetical protein